MRTLLGGIAALFAFMFIGLATAPAASAETVNCPLSQARRTVTNDLPSGWWTTPIVNSLTETRVQDIGGEPALVCVYGPAGSVQRNAPANHNCAARTGGFECTPRITLTPLPIPIPIPGAASASVHAQGGGVIRQTYMFDLDIGSETAAGADLWFQAVTNTELYLVPQNGARLALGDRSERGFAGCSSASYSNTRIALSSIPVGSFVCVRTSDNRVSQFRLNAITPSSPRTLTIAFTTWQ
jgi:hypothetical protein